MSSPSPNEVIAVLTLCTRCGMDTPCPDHPGRVERGEVFHAWRRGDRVRGRVDDVDVVGTVSAIRPHEVLVPCNLPARLGGLAEVWFHHSNLQRAEDQHAPQK